MIESNDLSYKEVYIVDYRLLKETNKSICDNLIENYKSLNKDVKEKLNFERKIIEASKEIIPNLDENNLTISDNICHYDEEGDLDNNKLSLWSLYSSKEKIIYESDIEDNKFKFEYNLSENMSLSEDLSDDIEDNILGYLKDVDNYKIEAQKSKSFDDEDLNYILEK